MSLRLPSSWATEMSCQLRYLAGILMPKTGAATEFFAGSEARSLLLVVTVKLQIASPVHTRPVLSRRAVIEIMTAPFECLVACTRSLPQHDRCMYATASMRLWSRGRDPRGGPGAGRGGRAGRGRPGPGGGGPGGDL